MKGRLSFPFKILTIDAAHTALTHLQVNRYNQVENTHLFSLNSKSNAEQYFLLYFPSVSYGVCLWIRIPEKRCSTLPGGGLRG